MKTFLFLCLVGYIFYILIISKYIVLLKYRKDKDGFQLQDVVDQQDLYDNLKNGRFTYPDMKNMRFNEQGTVTIEGKYTSHPLTIENGRLYVGRGEKGDITKSSLCMLEAEVIKAYLIKHFNPNAPIDAYKNYKTLKAKRLKQILVTTGIFAAFIAVATFANNSEIPKTVVAKINASNIDQSYLSEYSQTKTIGEAFNDFFANPKWKSYEQGVQKLVDFQGECFYDNEEVTITITFALFGDSFQIDNLKVNNKEMNPIQAKSIMEAVFKESDTTKGWENID